jgi:hypothetical protein
MDPHSVFCPNLDCPARSRSASSRAARAPRSAHACPSSRSAPGRYRRWLNMYSVVRLMPPSAPAVGCNSTTGSRVYRRRRGSARCWLSQETGCAWRRGDQRERTDQGQARGGPHPQRVIRGTGRIAMRPQCLEIQRNLADRGGQPRRDAVLRLSELAVAGLDRPPPPLGLARNSSRDIPDGWSWTRCRLDVSVPEGAPRPRQHARSTRIAVSTHLTPRRDHRWPQLHQALGGRTSFEAHPERLALERTGHL